MANAQAASASPAMAPPAQMDGKVPAPASVPMAAATKVEAPAAAAPVAAAPPSEPSAAKTSAVAAAAAETSEAAQARSAGRYRVLLLVPGGPLLFEFTCTIAGKPLEAYHAEVLAGYRRDADSDGDGRVTWDELLSNDSVRAAFLADAPINSERERVEFLRNYDLNRNGEVDAAEWPRLFRTSSSGRPFAVLNRDDDREWNREQSPLFTVLDSDENHRIDAAECRQAPARLRQLDADDDERLTRSEVMASRVETAGMAAPSVRRSLEPSLAWEISASMDWNGLQSVLQSIYGGGGPLAEGCFPARPALFAALDQDGNRRLSRRELERLADLPLAARWSIHWPDVNRSAPAPASFVPPQSGALELTSGNGETESPSESVPERVSGVWRMAAGNMRLAVFPINAAASGIDGGKVRVVAGFPPDALWTVADIDGDGQLLGRELETLGTRLLEFDRDGSSDVTRDELPELVWLAVVRGVTPAGAVGPPPALARSVPAMPASSTDAPVSAPSASGNPPADRAMANAPAPDWFDSLDANGDGQISQREFPGEPALFQQLDRNADGRLTVQEADRRP